MQNTSTANGTNHSSHEYKMSCLNAEVMDFLASTDIPFIYLLQHSTNNEWLEIRKLAAAHENCPPSLLEKLTIDLEPATRSLVASHNNTTLLTLEKLCEDDNYSVRAAVVKNQNCTDMILRKMANDCRAYIRALIAENDICPPDLLASYSIDPEWGVRDSAIFNPMLPVVNLLINACQDASSEIRLKAQELVGELSSEDWHESVMSGLSLNMHIDSDMPSTTLGDALLSADLNKAYQAIQSAELHCRIKSMQDKFDSPSTIKASKTSQLMM